MKTATAQAAASTPNGPLDWRLVLRWLKEDGVISEDEARRTEARISSAHSAQHPLQRLAVVGMARAADGHVLDAEALTQWLAQRCGLTYLRIDPLKVEVGKVAEVMSAGYAERHKVLPVQVGPAEVVVATAEPFLTDWVGEVARQTRKTVRLVLSSPAEITRYTAEFFALAKSVRAATKSGGSAGFQSFEQLVELGKGNKQIDANDQGVVQVVDWLWQYAFDQRASDIHLEPRREQGVIRFRIDGVLHPVYQLPLGVMNAMTARIKLLGRMDVVERRRPQDGRIKTLKPGVGGAKGDEVEMRLSTLPTAFGEKLVMRIFDPESTVKDLAALGFGAHDATRWEGLTRRPHGIVLVTGPTGSGKTTTLYATLKRLATEEVNVSTVEDPIEMIEPAFNQTQVQPHLDLDFAQGLRALMRQDPDIIMVGEIRDLETAEMAVQAALTGHLVFSTLHTNDAPSAVMRLMELGIPPYLINATVLGVLAQRLVRTLCAACKTRVEKEEAAEAREQLAELVKPWQITGGYRPYQPVGCIDCRMTGFRGRMGLYELLTVTEAFKNQVIREPRLETMRAQAVTDGMRPLRLAGAARVAEGLTTLDEVLATTPPVQ
ncbi:MAG: type II/IV secretion system protein [Hydrogenophaga sp.]|uniref:GspE/PulE family protein n=1 Tax=Hydrogenophaga sp. TaxID=1904254 RepID=UPI0016AA0AE0|nr:type II/IV secretion system protein [Hydrogenophaga sp.]NIM42325.1 type II/IV secretion system protein [Hydrogenophaga sp.]NIN28057.1 type II/IV secretion system protein [Hydrogenophaga sp.]NIN32835.1 type II/IV secretion system protein [Hydrogenophaga sp.]NIN54724.1 type II/IV secretion system protein [Hydrogenophaga sp.]NIO51400.1 type II/IV secretion system protein [Hydrogenophaga sp.]